MTSSSRAQFPLGAVLLTALLVVLGIGAIIWAALGIQASFLDDRVDRLIERSESAGVSAARPRPAAAASSARGGASPRPYPWARVARVARAVMFVRDKGLG